MYKNNFSVDVIGQKQGQDSGGSINNVKVMKLRSNF